MSILEINTADDYPWGILHNDSNKASVRQIINGAAYTWETVTHALYASVLDNDILKTQIANIDDVEQVKLYSQKCYYESLYKVRDEALYTAYNTLFAQSDQFRQILTVSGNLKYDGENTELGEACQDVLEVLQLEHFNGKANNNQDIFTDTDELSPFYPHNIYIRQRKFGRVVDYVYFSYYKYFTKTENEFPPNLSIIELTNTFRIFQDSYLSKIISSTCSEVILYKFTYNREAMRTLISAPNINVVDTGFLMHYINPQTSSILINLKTSNPLRLEPFRILDCTALISEPYIKEWIIAHRLSDLLTNIFYIQEYFQEPISVKKIISYFYSTCPIKQPDVLVERPPDLFYDWVMHTCTDTDSALWASVGTTENIYSLWEYISLLVDTVYTMKQNRDISFRSLITGFMNKTPATFSRITIFTAITTILNNIRELSADTLYRFSVGSAELMLVCALLRTNPCEIDPPSDFDAALAQHIRSKFDKEITWKIYYIVDYIYLKSTAETRSRVNLYS